MSYLYRICHILEICNLYRYAAENIGADSILLFLLALFSAGEAEHPSMSPVRALAPQGLTVDSSLFLVPSRILGAAKEDPPALTITKVGPRYHCLRFHILHTIYSQFSSLTSC